MKRLSYIFAFAALLALGYCAIEFGRAWLYQTREERHFVWPQQQEMPVPLSSPNVRRPRPGAGSALAKLVIPRIGLSTIVLEGAGERELKLGAGHIRGTALPGEGGNIGFAAHRDTFFRPLRLIRKNDVIKVIANDREYRYKVVSEEIVSPDDVDVLYSSGRETLTLVTCYPFHYIGSAPSRFIVRADRDD